MARTVQARLDDAAQRDLALLRQDAGSDSEAVRLAIRDAAARLRRRSALRLEAERAASEERDLAVIREVQAEMDVIAVDWPAD